MTWWKKMDPLAKAITALGAAVLLGMALGAWIGLPAQVKENTQRLDEMQPAVDMLECWAEHEIRNTDPAECLFINGGQ